MSGRLVAGIGGLAVATAAGVPVLVGFVVLALVLVGFAGWVVASKARTANTVALIIAARSPNARRRRRTPGTRRGSPRSGPG